MKFSNTNPSSLPLFNYITEGSPPPSNLCNALVYMSDDNSKIRNIPCSSVRTGGRGVHEALYEYIYYVRYQAQITIYDGVEYDCDDHIQAPGYNKYGTWIYYVK